MRSYEFPRVQALPGLERASLCIDGVERVGYEFQPGRPKPFFFPILGPSGAALTRIGHPDPVGHEHHRSVWFGHQAVNGVNFWEEPRLGSDVQIRHKLIRVYEDGSEWAGFAAEWDWWAGGRALLRQGVIAVIEPRQDGGFALDLQSRFESANGAPLELGRTNFGFLGVRVAKTMSEQFGGGRLTNAEGQVGEDAIFGTRSRWVDYSGPVAPGVFEGIAYFDHPGNPRHPSHWHVRRDGWMEASFCMAEAYGVAQDHPLELRYRLLIHSGPSDREAIEREWSAFEAAPSYRVEPPSAGDVGHLVRAT